MKVLRGKGLRGDPLREMGTSAPGHDRVTRQDQRDSQKGYGWRWQDGPGAGPHGAVRAPGLRGCPGDRGI